MDTADAVTCVVVDDHPSVLDAVARSLSLRGISVVGTATDGATALARLAETEPRVAVVDIQLPDMSGIDVVRTLAGRGSPTRVLLFTGEDETALLRAGIEAGASGFIVKTSSLDELATAIQTVADGGIYVDADLAGEIVRQELDHELADVSPREREVLSLLSQGLDYEQIGERLFVSAGTVRVDVRNAISKLEAENRTQAVAEALRQRLIP